jgi:hypothetical protein
MDQGLPQEEAGKEGKNSTIIILNLWNFFFLSRARIQEALAFASENFKVT